MDSVSKKTPDSMSKNPMDITHLVRVPPRGEQSAHQAVLDVGVFLPKLAVEGACDHEDLFGEFERGEPARNQTGGDGEVEDDVVAVDTRAHLGCEAVAGDVVEVGAAPGAQHANHGVTTQYLEPASVEGVEGCLLYTSDAADDSVVV